ncbi:MAG TPA: universal stress protein [Kiritimatiellia bacterium]|nr:universal stress protein [Kiritimatiellia bacterium]HMP00518.1 universal stress protein [Kiritimatiellia bacterium]HMP97624.1 universal stress protein [Kiritimatiellia bacterium]
MIKSILVCTDGSPHGDYSIHYGIHLALRFQARLTGLHVLDSRMLEGPWMANVSGWLGAQPFTDPLNQFRAIMQEKGEAILAAFRAQCREAGISDCDAVVKWGHPAQVILREEIGAEMVILGQDGEHDEITGEWTGSTVDRVVRHSIKPTLVVPRVFVPIDKIMIAYDGSPHASRALREAIELALALAVPLVIATVAEGGDHNRAMDHAETAMRLARAHECAAAHLIVEGRTAEVLVAKAEELGCGLLVAGAHGHSRVREWFLGGTAHKLLHITTVPLLLVR